MRIGLYGGTFAPIHCGHLLVAQAASEELHLDRLVFIPAARSPFKPERDGLDGSWRLKLLRLALAGRPEYMVSALELERGGSSFTIDTVERFRDWYPEGRFFCLIGMDHLGSLPLWKEAERLSRRVEFAVIPRPGSLPSEAPPGFRCHFLRGTPIDLSSSKVRERAQQRRPLVPFVLPVVAEAIERYQLYSREGV